MILQFANYQYEADKFIKNETTKTIKGYNDLGDEIFRHNGISDFSLYSLNGEFVNEEREQEKTARLEQQVTDQQDALVELATILGGMM